MVSINTNISSLVAQRNMTTNTNKLNIAIERMSTGYKINHAGDNAANYSISRNMNVQLSACDIAADNIAMGMDLLQTAQDTIAGMQERGSRIQAMITQARNGTYSASSMTALNSEVQAIATEINRLYMNTEYNGIKLFEGGFQLPEWAQTVKANAGVIDGKSLEECAATNNGFIAEVVCDTPDVTVTDPKQLARAISSNTKIGIGNARTLAKLAELVNAGTSCSGKTIILTDDIDLSDYQDGEGWTPIGNNRKAFAGNFCGNGHKISGLYINREDTDYQGLFGYVAGDIQDIGLEGVNVTGLGVYTGGLAGYANNTITNSYATGTVTGGNDTGGLVGYTTQEITNSYATGSVTGNDNTGGLAGRAGAITNSYATGSVAGQNRTGGLAGSANGTITNSYATGNVSGNDYTGGLAGWACTINDSYATGSVTGNNRTGGLAGYASGAITDSFATGNVSGTSWVGGLVGEYYKTSGTVTLDQILSSGTVSGTDKVGSLIGGIVNTTNGTRFSTINITNALARSGGDMIGFEGDSTTAYSSGQMEGWLSNISEISGGSSETTLQVGINGGGDSQISVNTGLSFDLSISDLTSDEAYNSITTFLNQLSQKSTELGAAQNRLESALESTLVQMDNLTSSLSTIRDADMGKVSADYIRQQILQQATATLLSTANQSPAIALQLI